MFLNPSKMSGIMRNPLETMSARSIRIIYSICAFVTLIVCGERFLQAMVFRVTSNDQCAWLTLDGGRQGALIAGVAKGGVTDRAGVMDGDTLTKINGIAFTSTRQAQAIVDSLKAGDFATYTLKRGDKLVEARVEMGKVFDVRFLSIFLLGLGFFIVGYVVVMTKPQGQIQRMFGRYGIYALLVFTLFPPTVALDPQWKTRLLVPIFIFARALGPPMFVKFFWYFPTRRRVLKRRWPSYALYGVNTLILVSIFLVLRPTSPTWLALLFLSTPIWFFCSGLGVFWRSYAREAKGKRKDELRPILYAVMIGMAATLYLGILGAINPFAIFLNPVLVLPALLLVSIPLAFGYAIFRYRLMDIDLIVKRSLIYGVVTASLAAVYILTVFGMGSLLGLLIGQSDSKVLSIAAFVIIAFMFDPLKRRVQDYIDRVFYRERRDYQKALLGFSQELPRQMNFNEILSSMVARISETMHVEKVAVVLCGDSRLAVSKNIPEKYSEFADSADGLIPLLKASRTAHSFALLAEEPDSVVLDEADRARILDSGIILVVPMFIQDRLIGMINVGPKLSGKIYSQEDIDLLSTVAGQAAIAIENSRLHKSEIEKQKIEEELSLARRIQVGLLPKANPAIEGLDISGISVPALTVGGDYFDYIMLGPKQVLVVVADVSGKGMSASLYMSKVQGMVQLAAQMYKTPREILINVNRRLYDGMERKSFITMILALFDMDKREVCICRAGHHKAMVRMNGELKYLDAKGIGLGLERGPLFESELQEIRHPLAAGALFLFYSDGLTEAMNRDQAEFGEEKISHILNAAARGRSAGELQETIIAAVKNFTDGAEQHDDLTLVVVRAS